MSPHQVMAYLKLHGLSPSGCSPKQGYIRRALFSIDFATGGGGDYFAMDKTSSTGFRPYRSNLHSRSRKP